jgi:hypothetical protein
MTRPSPELQWRFRFITWVSGVAQQHFYQGPGSNHRHRPWQAILRLPAAWLLLKRGLL